MVNKIIKYLKQTSNEQKRDQKFALTTHAKSKQKKKRKKTEEKTGFYTR